MQKQLIGHMDRGEDNFYFMINPSFPTPAMFAELAQNLPHLIRYYPSNQQVISEKIKKLEKVDRPLLAVNGSCEAIRVFLQHFAKKPLVTVPNFNEWEITNHVPLAYDASTAEVRAAIQQHNVDTICFCNPNNPTGYYREDIEQLASEFPQVRFAVDVSFIDFVDEHIPPLPQGKNIVLFKSLGKNYGICGIRLGYVASEDAALIKQMLPYFPIWNINSVAEFLLDQILQHREEYEASRRQIIQGTRKMEQFLRTIPYFTVYPTNANFVLVKSEKPLSFNVKCCDNKTGLDKMHYRFAYNPHYEQLQELLLPDGVSR